MNKRTCLMIDDDVDKDLRRYQSSLIKKINAQLVILKLSIMFYVRIVHEKKMNSFKECPKCAKDGLTIPVYEGFEGMVCSLCNSVYDK